MNKNRRPGYAGVALLKALEGGARYGLDLMSATGHPSGTVYPQLRRLEQRGFVRAEWEVERTAREEGRPRRRYYEITRDGRVALAAVLAELSSLTAPSPQHGSASLVGDA